MRSGRAGTGWRCSGGADGPGPDRLPGELLPEGARSHVTRCVHGLLALTLAACGGDVPVVPPPPPEPPQDTVPTGPAPIAIPAVGTGATLDIGTWNIQYFGAANQGPTDEALQLQRAQDVIAGTDADIWALQEVTAPAAFDSLVARLPGYAGVLASDASVEGGSDAYHTGELKVGLVYKTEIMEATGARVILTELDYEFAGRPPLEVTARISAGGGAVHDAVVVVLHAKASRDTVSWARRAAAGAGLKDYLDRARGDVVAIVAGDWNDVLDGSITQGRETPYRVFVEAAPEWVFPTAPLGTGGATSILGYESVIDHILASDEAMAWYEEGSATIHRVDDHIPEYEDAVSDHLPVVVRFRVPGG